MAQVVAADIGRPHARFALSAIQAGAVRPLKDQIAFKTAEHARFQTPQG